MSQDFRPSASIAILRERAQIMKTIRSFFDDKGFFEVDTPVLSHDSVVDRYIEPLSIAGTQLDVAGENKNTFWLQTSPEFTMKRLLASGADAIYQIAHAFRGGESGDFHNPEFSMLEWYRTGDDMRQGMDLLAEFAESILGSSKCKKTTYQDAFKKHAQIDPFGNDVAAFVDSTIQHEIDASVLEGNDDLDQWRNLILTQIVEPKLGVSAPEIIYDWPASQSALAIVRNEVNPVAERFELYFRGVELANGYHELQDANELRKRNATVNAQRLADGKTAVPESSQLLNAMENGLPACSGVALGVDRLVMLATGQQNIADVIAFPISNC